jgi:hypothetical protein
MGKTYRKDQQQQHKTGYEKQRQLKQQQRQGD